MNHRASTKVENLGSAKEFAEDWYLTLCGKQRNGGLVTERTVTHAAEAFQKEYEVGRTKPRVFEEVTETE